MSISDIEELKKENARLRSMNDRLLRNIDGISLAAQKRVETASAVMAGVLLKNLRRRSVTVRLDDIVNFPSTNTVNMTADDTGDFITYSLDGDFDGGK